MKSINVVAVAPKAWFDMLALLFAAIVLAACTANADRASPPLPTLVPTTAGAVEKAKMLQARVELDIFSGRPNPSWALSTAETITLTTMIEELAPASPIVFPDALGYRGLVVFLTDGASNAATSLKVYNGAVQRGDGGTATCRADPGRRVERWLLATARPWIDDQLYALVARQVESDDLATPARSAPSLPIAPSAAPPAGTRVPATATAVSPKSDDLVSGIRGVLPAGWTLTVITDKGKMGHPHGLEEPIFRIDLTDPTHAFEWQVSPGEKRQVHPYLRLHFHSIKDKERILETIKSESVYSWDIPIYFSETKEYIIVTSPAYINYGVYTDEAKALFAPLERALKDYFASRKQ